MRDLPAASGTVCIEATAKEDTMSLAIRAEGLVKRFGTTQALGGVEFEVSTGTVVGLLGPNGAGKTTVVRILATLPRPDAGRATVGGHDVLRDPHRVRSLIGLTGQYASVAEDLSGTENLVLLGRLLDLPRATAKARALEPLDQFELAEAAGRAAKTYSGGLRRRLAEQEHLHGSSFAETAARCPPPGFHSLSTVVSFTHH